MNQEEGQPASEWFQSVTAEELAWVFHVYGEDDDQLHSERVAEAIPAKQEALCGQISNTNTLPHEYVHSVWEGVPPCHANSSA